MVLIVAFLSASFSVMPVLGRKTMVPNLMSPVWSAMEDKFDIEYDETRALDAKSEQFWQPVLDAAEEVKPNEHAALYRDVEAVIAKLPEENTYVRTALRGAVKQLRLADDALEARASEDSELAAEKLATPAGGLTEGFSFFTGSQKLLSLAVLGIRHLLGFSYQERLHEQIQQRQTDILPSLRGAAKATANVLAETREASKTGFDILKYDIYQNDVPKTPEAAKQIAQRIVDAADEDRHKFLRPIVTSVDGIAQDVRSEKESPAATVASSLGFDSHVEA